MTDPPHLTSPQRSFCRSRTTAEYGPFCPSAGYTIRAPAKRLQVLQPLLDHPRTTRMPSIAIYGDSGMGKTMIMEKFRRRSSAAIRRCRRRRADPGARLCRWQVNPGSVASTRRS